MVSVLFSEPKIPQLSKQFFSFRTLLVSVLFSEPKIPQRAAAAPAPRGGRGFSALQRAENSSTAQRREMLRHAPEVSVLFSEPKIPQLCPHARRRRLRCGFQCSSASRKFLNAEIDNGDSIRIRIVSVLFSEPKIPQPQERLDEPSSSTVSVLFSEPKIPQLASCDARRRDLLVSVLFSEPKIPQPRRDSTHQ